MSLRLLLMLLLMLLLLLLLLGLLLRLVTHDRGVDVRVCGSLLRVVLGVVGIL